MKKFPKILICIGCRPAEIKVRSLVAHLPNVKTLFTGQQSDLVKDTNFDYKLKIDGINENRLNDIVCSILKHNNILKGFDYVLCQGDTCTTFSICLSAFHNKVKVIHLEAGLRTHDIQSPFPEEGYRCMISRLATINLSPTKKNMQNLLREKVPGKCYVVGNTGLDNINKEGCVYGNKVLITMHRRENHNLMHLWFTVLSNIAKKYSDLEFIIPLHPNPNIQKHKHLLKNINVIDPITHEDCIKLMKECRFIISDSGGIIEESSFLNKKMIVCRTSTERPESLGVHSFLCPSPNQLEKMVDEVYDDYEVNAKCPFGQGNSWKLIKKILENL